MSGKNPIRQTPRSRDALKRSPRFDPAQMYGKTDITPGAKVRLGVGVCVRDGQGGVLLERRSDSGCWGLLGGGVEPGESIVQTALREVMEESGLEVEVTRFIGVYSEPQERIVVYPDNGDERHLVDIILEARIIAGSLRRSEESLDLAFFKRDDIPQELAPPARQPLEDYFRDMPPVLR